jgi:hypothetical protein
VDEKRFRFDLLVALLALAISGIAAGSSAYQTYVIRKQFSATVWPYLNYITLSSTDHYFEIDVSNPGIGPALIFDSTVTRDGRVVSLPATPTTLPALAAALAPEAAEAKREALQAHTFGGSHMSASTILAGDVLPAGAKLQLLRVDGKFITRRVLANIGRIDLTLCYCSLLGDCWTKRLGDPVVRPHPVAACKNG